MCVLSLLLQQFRRVTSIGSLPPKKLGKTRGPPQNPAEPRRTLGETSAEPAERPPQSPLKGKFPRRASRRVVPLGWSVCLPVGLSVGQSVSMCEGCRPRHSGSATSHPNNSDFSDTGRLAICRPLAFVTNSLSSSRLCV